MTGAPGRPEEGTGALAVLANRPFLLLWLSQLATQVGGNMVLYGLTVIVVRSTSSNAAVSALFLTFLLPAVLLSALAGVYVDRIDRRLILVVTNIIRALAFVAIFLVGENLLAILVLNVFVSIVNVFFTPAEGAMIPHVVPRHQLVSANGIFTLTLNAAFIVGFALLGPVVTKIAGPQGLILFVAVLFLVAAAFCFTLPPAPPTSEPVSARRAVSDAERAMESTFAQLREGLGYIRSHRSISWSLVYLGIAASLTGILGVLGPDLARETLGLAFEDSVVVILPLGFGIVTGILFLNSYGRFLPRRRVIEFGLIGLGILLALLSAAGTISQFLQRSATVIDLSAVTSLLVVVVGIALLAGICYAIVAIPSQTQLQEDLPEDVRGRVFGVLNMLLSVTSMVPIIVVGPISDVVGTTAVVVACAVLIAASGVVSVLRRGPLQPPERLATAEAAAPGVTADPMGVVQHDPRSRDEGASNHPPFAIQREDDHSR
ncbi:MAG TPA: MFS transporter [Candidatus Limnocylindrales bacterium]